MANLFDYIGWERSTFDEKPFGPLDAAVLTQACMIDAPGVVPGTSRAPGILTRLSALISPQAFGARFEDIISSGGDDLPDDMFTGLVPGDIRHLLHLLAASPRFRDLRLRDLRSVVSERRSIQFGAMTFTWRDRFAFVGFRGTDSGLAGWRENCAMCYEDETGSQRLARRYLGEVAGHLPRRLHVGGHSKGGNLALYAALTCPDTLLERVERIWALDAPGFKPGRFAAGDYDRVRDRAVRLAPQDSIVGALLEDAVPIQTVRSFAFGPQQHSVFTWEVSGDDFERLERPSDFSLGVAAVTSEWIAGMDIAERRRAVDALFAAARASGAKSAGELLAGGTESLRLVREAASKVDDGTREVLNRAIGELVRITARHAGEDAARSLFGWLG